MVKEIALACGDSWNGSRRQDSGENEQSDRHHGACWMDLVSERLKASPCGAPTRAQNHPKRHIKAITTSEAAPAALP